MQISLTVSLLFSLLLLVFVATTEAHNITKILGKHPEFSTFNHYLTLTHLAPEINRRQTITVCALDNSAMSDLLSKGFSIPTLRNILSLHVLVDFYGPKKLHQLTNGTTLTASLFQSTGDAAGNSGYVNITDLSGGKVGFAVSDSPSLASFFVKSVTEMPYNISVIQISSLLTSSQAEAPAPEPSAVNVTKALSGKGCKSFSDLLTSSGAIKTFQESLDGGLTIFCAVDAAVKGFMSKYKNLTDGNKTAVMLFHGVPVYNSMGMLKSSNGVMNTLATDGANKFDFTVQNDGDDVTLKTKVATAKITGTLVDEDPLVIYKVDKVLLPRELFKAEPAAEAPAPEAEPPKGAKDGVAAEPDTSVDDGEADDQTAEKKSGVGKINGGGLILMGLMSWWVLLW